MGGDAGQGLKRTALYDRHVAAGAKLVGFGGWEMPLSYGSQIEEHLACRREAAMFDVSHMGQIEIAGGDALALVQQLVPTDIARLGDGEQGLSVLLTDEGGLIDDLIVARLDAVKFLLVVNAATYGGDVARVQQVAAEAGLPAARVRPCAEDYAMIALQGPRALEVLARAVGEDLCAGMPFMRIRGVATRFGEMLVSRTGYTGEAGCELMIAPQRTGELWEALEAAGARPAGLAARDSLRLEMGYCLSGQDFTSANNPYEARLGWLVDLEKGDFRGREALRRIKAEGGARRLLTGLLPEGRRIPRHGMKVMRGDEVVGEVTSGGFSPTLERGIALGYVMKDAAKAGMELEIDLGSARVKAEAVRVPFVKR